MTTQISEHPLQYDLPFCTVFILDFEVNWINDEVMI